MRRLLALVSAIIFVDALLFTALTPLVPSYADEFDLSKTGAGLLVGAYGAGALFGGIPGGLAAARWGPKREVVGALLLLAVASFAFATADSAVALGFARFVQGIASTATWAGALAWISVEAPRERRGEVIGTTFGVAIFGAVLGPVFGGVAEYAGIGLSFGFVGVVTLAFAGLAAVAQSVASRDDRARGPHARAARSALPRRPVAEPAARDVLRRPRRPGAAHARRSRLEHARDRLRLLRGQPRGGRAEPTPRTVQRSRRPVAADPRVARRGERGRPRSCGEFRRRRDRRRSSCVATISFGSFYTPGISLTSHRADAAGLAQGLSYGVMNTAWAFGELVGPTGRRSARRVRRRRRPVSCGCRALLADARGDVSRRRKAEAA